MAEVDPLILRLIAETGEYNRRLRESERTFTSATDRMGASAARLTRLTEASLGRLQGAIAGVSAIALARTFLSIADANKQLEAQLRLATAAFGTYGQAQKDVARIADETRGGLNETASLYGNFVRATRDLGGSQNDAARATETFSKALKIGGADANAAASATLQFGQALASGALRGDEFNSIAEASPRILQLLADALGVSRGEIRGLAADGKLTSDVLFRALTDRKFTANIDAEFKQLPVTFDEAMTRVFNAAQTTFGAFDRGGQFSTAIANFVSGGSDGFGDLESAAEDLGIQIRAEFAGLANAFTPMVDGAFSAFGKIEQKAQSSAEYIAGALRVLDQIANVRVDIANAEIQGRNALLRGGVLNRTFGGERPLQERSNLAGRFLQGFQRTAAQGRVDAAARRLEGQGFIVPRNADGSVNEAGIRRRPQAAPVTPRTISSGTSGGKAMGRAAASPKEDEVLEDFRQRLNDFNDNLLTFYSEAQQRFDSAVQRAIGGDAGREFDDIISDLDRRQGARLAEVDQEYEDKRELERDLQYQREDNVRSLAGLYEDLLTGGSKSVAETLKREGIRAVAEILARLALGQAAFGGESSSGSLFSSLASIISGSVGGGSGAPKYIGKASGGYVNAGQMYRINEGARPGMPEGFRPLGAGHVIPLGQMDALARPQGTTVQQSIYVDSRGAVMNREFAAQILAQAKQYSAEAGTTAYNRAVSDVPRKMRQDQRFGTG